MSSALTKRQQAKNERILQDLIKNPGNDRCADCATRNPAWASWSLGIFLCIRCASLHRKLGTHISKVKSISMDSWNNDQIDTMRKNGNIKSNAYFNPEPSKHPAPLSSEDSDSDLERYIRAKYEYQHFRRDATSQGSSVSSLSSGASTSSASFGLSVTPTGASNGLSPSSSTSSNISFPSAPARTARRSASQGFGVSRLGIFRSASPSNAKVSQILGTTAAPYTDRDAQPRRAPLPTSPSPTSVQFPHGMVRMSEAEKYGEQLNSLHDMGFRDVKKNLEVLASTNGKILDAVEILVRLGKIGGDDKPAVPPKNSSDGFGLTVQRTGPAGISLQKSSDASSSNPWDIRQKDEEPLPPLPPRTQANVPAPVAANGFAGYNNPWNTQQNGNSYVQPQLQQQDPSSFQMNGLAQALPNYPQQSQPMTNPYAIQQQQQQQQQSLSPNATGYNPFMTSASAPPQNMYQSPPPASAPLHNPNPYFQQLQQSNPYQQQQQTQSSSYQLQLQPSNPYQQQQSQPQPQPQPQQNGYATSYSAQGAQASYSQQQQPSFYNMPQQQQPASLQYSHTGVNKSAILALYGAPHLAPQPNPSPVQVQQQAQSAPVTPSVSTGSNNPFAKPPIPTNGMNGSGSAAAAIMAGRGAGTGPGGRHMSQESVDFGAWQSGRHSPDAFASLAFGGR